MKIGTRVAMTEDQNPYRTSAFKGDLTGEVVFTSAEIPGGRLYRVAFDLEHREALVENFTCDWVSREDAESRLVLGRRFPDEYPGDQRVSLLLYGHEISPIQ